MFWVVGHYLNEAGGWRVAIVFGRNLHGMTVARIAIGVLPPVLLAGTRETDLDAAPE